MLAHSRTDVYYVPSVENVQTLLVLSLVDELGDRPRVSPVTVQRNRMASAFRLALDSGMTRSRLEREVRVWRCLQIIDTWRAAKDGVPMMHPPALLSETNIREPSPLSPFSGLNRSPPQPTTLPGSDASKAALGHLYGVTFFERLYSVTRLLARVLNLFYGPDGVTEVDSAAVLKLKQDLAQWRDSLPISFKFDYNSAKFQTVRTQRRVQESGLLLMCYNTVGILCLRPLMPWSFRLPKNVRPEVYASIDDWVDIMKLSRHSVDFAINLEETSEMLFFFGVFALNHACLVLYHTWARRGEWEGSIYLDKVRRCYDRLLHGPETHLPFLRRVSDMCICVCVCVCVCACTYRRTRAPTVADTARRT